MTDDDSYTPKTVTWGSYIIGGGTGDPVRLPEMDLEHIWPWGYWIPVPLRGRRRWWARLRGRPLTEHVFKEYR